MTDMGVLLILVLLGYCQQELRATQNMGAINFCVTTVDDGEKSTYYFSTDVLT
jgi:hypothetical protein